VGLSISDTVDGAAAGGMDVLNVGHCGSLPCVQETDMIFGQNGQVAAERVGGKGKDLGSHGNRPEEPELHQVPDKELAAHGGVEQAAGLAASQL